MELSAELKKKMEYMKEQGLEFSLDDLEWDTTRWYSCRRSCFNEVKIDGNLVSQLPNNKSTREIISRNCSDVPEFELPYHSRICGDRGGREICF